MNKIAMVVGLFCLLVQTSSVFADAAGVPQSVQNLRDCPECPEMVVIPAGSFKMGSNNGESAEKPIHRVTFNHPFAMGRTEVTQRQWKAIMGSNPSGFSSCGDNCPVEKVSWDDAQEFILRLNQKTGKQYRLPTEAEWEYACRAGGRQAYCGSDKPDTVGWYVGNSGTSTAYPGMSVHPAASLRANGLYDMSGNVWEWMEDSDHGDYVALIHERLKLAKADYEVRYGKKS